MKLETKAVHSGEPSPLVDGAVVAPIFTSTTYRAEEVTDYADTRYSRLGNTPTHLTVARKIAALEGAEKGLITGSGMAAITTTLLSLVGPGEHLIAQEELYGASYHFIKADFPKFGREASVFSADNTDKLPSLLTKKTRAIYVEAISNPLVKIPDLERVVSFAKEYGLVSIIDSTFATPVNFNPIELGFDIAVHSATKYLNGHSDVVCGAIVGNAKLIDQVNHLLGHLGGCLDPHACYQLNRGIKTLAVRVRYQNELALRLATWLERAPGVSKVHYPGLETHPQYARARKLFRGSGGMLAFELATSAAETDKILSRLKIAHVAPSLGGPETLVTRPAMTSHSLLPPAERARLGITDGLVRVSVGLEDIDDLIADFGNALAKT